MSTDRSGRRPGELDGDEGEYPDDIDARERFVLYCLSTHGTMSLWDVADEVIVWETGNRLPEVPRSDCRKVYLSLYHTHVPRLERAGLVEYHSKRDLLALADAALGLACREPRPPADEEETLFSDQ